MLKNIFKSFSLALIIFWPSIGLSHVWKIFPFLRGPFYPLAVYLGRLIILFFLLSIFSSIKPFHLFESLGIKKNVILPFISGFIVAFPFIFFWITGCIMNEVPIHFSTGSYLSFFFAFLGPGLFEEALFRGVLFNRLLSVLNWWKAAFLTGIFFGPAHLVNFFVGHDIKEISISILAGFIMSFPFGFMYFRTKGNLWPCISVHFFIAGTMDAFISETLIKSNLNDMIPGIVVGLLGTICSIFHA